MSSGWLEILLRVCESDFVLNGKWGLAECSGSEKILSMNANGRGTVVGYSCCQMRGINGLGMRKFSAVRQSLQLFALMRAARRGMWICG